MSGAVGIPVRVQVTARLGRAIRGRGEPWERVPMAAGVGEGRRGLLEAVHGVRRRQAPDVQEEVL
jgi:hypothetical protein